MMAPSGPRGNPPGLAPGSRAYRATAWLIPAVVLSRGPDCPVGRNPPARRNHPITY